MPHQKNKSHKTGHASKREVSRRAQGRVEQREKKGSKRGANIKTKKGGNVTGSRDARKNKTKILIKDKREAAIYAHRIGSTTGPPRLVGFIGLSAITDAELLASHLSARGQPVEGLDYTRVYSERKFRMTFLPGTRDLDSQLDICKVSDVLVLVINVVSDAQTQLTNTFAEDDNVSVAQSTAKTLDPLALGLCVDDLGQKLISILTAFGLPTCILALQGLGEIPSHKRRQTLARLHERWAHTHISERVKVVSVENDGASQDALIRAVQETKLHNVIWRQELPYFVAERTEWTAEGDLRIGGFLRGKNAEPGSIFHIAHFGSFQSKSIDVVKPGQKTQTFAAGKMEALEWCRVPDTTHNEQTWPTKADYDAAAGPGMIDTGVGSVGGDEDMGDADSDLEGSAGGSDMGTRSRGLGGRKTLGGGTEVMTQVDALMATDIEHLRGLSKEQVEAERERIAKERMQTEMDAEEDRARPDEVETPFHIPARDRFARFRGLASFRTSPWDPYESLPVDYSRIFEFKDLASTRKLVFQEMDTLDIKADNFVVVTLTGVPKDEFENACRRLGPHRFLSVCGLRKHEQLFSVLNMTLQHNGDYAKPIKSKESLLVHVGFRVLRCNPIYSENNSGKRGKFLRFFQPEDRFAIATIYGPTTYAPAPVLCFKTPDVGTGAQCADLAAFGQVHNVDPLRTILKKIVLTGYPYKVHKRQAVVRMMFFNAPDITHFKPVQLYTKLGLTGHIREPLGTHGYMKCQFNNLLYGHDVVCMDLWKRVYPKWTTVQVSLMPSVEAQYTCTPEDDGGSAAGEGFEGEEPQDE